MKKSSEWVRKPALDKMLDQLVEQLGITPAELIPYDAAKAFDIEPSGEFYKKVRDWKQRRAEASDNPVTIVPPHILASFRETVDRFGVGAVLDFERAVGSIGGDIRRYADQRVAEADQRTEAALNEVNGLIDHWTATEAERDTARASVAELKQQVEKLRRINERLLGRLEQRGLDGRAQEAASASVPKVSDGTPQSDGAAHAYALAYGPPKESGGEVGDDSASSAVTEVKGQPPAIEADRPTGGQGEMPIVDDATANKADGGDDDRG